MSIIRRPNKPAPLLEEGGEQSSTVSTDSSFAGNGKPAPSTYLSLEDLPVGEGVFSKIWEFDPTPDTLKTLLTGLTVAGLVYMVFSVFLWTDIVGVDGSWDESHGFERYSFWAFPQLMAVALGLPSERLYNLLFLTYGAYFLLLAADLVLGSASSPNDNRTHPWPKSWKTDNTLCYHDMFCEPTRFGRLLRRPGNTLSNVNYMLSAACVSFSTFSGNENVFWMGDALFGAMLFLLGIFSNLWHASNAPWTQYADLWSMDSCILYLIIRHVCFGALSFMLKSVTTNRALAQQVAGMANYVIFAAVVFALGKLQWALFQKGWLHSQCPFSARSRLHGKSCFFGGGQLDCHVTTICYFAAMPVGYTAVPTLIQVCLIGSTGSVSAANWAFWSLIIGWIYRLWDRWVLDGCVFMKYFTAPGKPTLFHTIGAALFSPTASLHFFTGITLLAAYTHARSLEEYV